MRLSDTSRSEEHEHSNRFVRILESDSVSLYRLDNFLYGIILTHDCTLETVAHIYKPTALSLRDALCRHTCHHCHHFSYFLPINFLAVAVERLLPFLFG